MRCNVRHMCATAVNADTTMTIAPMETARNVVPTGAAARTQCPDTNGVIGTVGPHQGAISMDWAGV